MKSSIIITLILFIGINAFAQNNNYQYDNLLRLNKVTFSNGGVHEYSYDQLGNRTIKVTNSTATQLADLIIQNQSLNQTTMAPGAIIDMSCRVANTGSCNAGGHYLKIYLSSNQTFESGSDVEIGSIYNVAIAQGNYQQISTNSTIPQGTIPGTWYILFYADATLLSNETDENNNTAFIQISVVNCTSMQLSATKTDATCGNNNGTAAISVTGGQQPFAYQWNNGQNSNIINNLGGNTYAVTVTDFYGCTATKTVIINTVNPPSIVMSSTNTTCGAANGSASVSVSGGTSPYTYLWNTGQTSATINNLAAGNYNVSVTDSSTCTLTGSVVVNSPANISVSLYSTDPTCGINNGVISSIVTGGMQPYSYLWSNGQTGYFADSLLPGMYTCTVTDANNCQYVSSKILSSVNNMSLTFSSTKTTCGLPNGTAMVTATNGTAPFSYLWSNGQITQTATNLAQGSYNVTVTDSLLCSATSYATVGAIVPPVVLLSSTTTSCTSNTGTITSTVSNGTSPFTYLWNTGQTTSSLNSLPAGSYSVTVTDHNGCTTSFSTIVQYAIGGSNPNITVSLGNDTTLCNNQNLILDAGAGFNSYTWSSGENTQAIILADLIPGVHPYFVIVNACGTTSSDTILVSINPIPDPAGIISGAMTVCQGQNLVVYSVPSIPNSNSYTWSLPNGATGTSTTNSISVNYGTSATSGNITVKGTNSCGDGTASSLPVTVNPLPDNAGTIIGTTTVCQGQNSLNYTIPTIANATSYLWTLPSGATGTSTTNIITVNFGMSATSGSITVKGKNTCGDGSVSSLPITVNVKPSAPTISINGNILHSDAPLGNQWYDQNGLINGETNQDYTATASGDYYVIVTLNGCNSNQSNTIHYNNTGLDFYENYNTINIFPNPVTNELIIEFIGNNEKKNFEIINEIGQVVHEGNMVEKVTVQTSKFAPGIYLIKLENGKTFEFKKIIKE